MFIVALPIIAPNWMELKCPSAGAWVNKLLYVYVMAYYTAIKRNELPIHVTTCTDLKIIMSSEKNATHERLHSVYDAIYMTFCIRQNHSDRKRTSGRAGSWRRGTDYKES